MMCGAGVIRWGLAALSMRAYYKCILGGPTIDCGFEFVNDIESKFELHYWMFPCGCGVSGTWACDS